MKNKGFTLIELLIVIGIIAILAAAVIIAINPGQQFAQARDATRKSHVNSIKKAILSYQIDNLGSLRNIELQSTFKEICNTNEIESAECEDLIDLSILSSQYISSIPVDPRGGEHDKGIGYAVAKIDGEVKVYALMGEAGYIGDVAPFTFQIETTEPNQTFTFRVDDADVTIKWREDSTTNHKGTLLISREYETPGVHTIYMRGTASRIAFGPAGNNTPNLLIDILAPVSPGVSGITSANSMFRDAENITEFTAKNFFDEASGSVTSMSDMFREAANFNMDLNNWNTSNVTNMNQMFHLQHTSPKKFNGNISNWDTANVRHMISMFKDAQLFNQDIGNWDTGNVIYMNNMFYQNREFNQDISNWDTGNVRDMRGMFRSAWKFNQDIGNWNVSNVEYMGGLYVFDGMFAGASSFDQDLSRWNITSVQNFRSFLDSARLSVNNYDALLIEWSKLDLQSGTVEDPILFHGGNSKYSAAAVTARQSIIDNFNWEITDGGQAN